MNKKYLAAGLMSGTSADGLTIALCEISSGNLTEERHIKTLLFRNYDYSPALHEKIIGAKDMKAFELAELNFELGRI